MSRQPDMPHFLVSWQVPVRLRTSHFVRFPNSLTRCAFRAQGIPKEIRSAT